MNSGGAFVDAVCDARPMDALNVALTVVVTLALIPVVLTLASLLSSSSWVTRVLRWLDREPGMVSETPRVGEPLANPRLDMGGVVFLVALALAGGALALQIATVAGSVAYNRVDSLLNSSTVHASVRMASDPGVATLWQLNSALVIGSDGAALRAIGPTTPASWNVTCPDYVYGRVGYRLDEQVGASESMQASLAALRCSTWNLTIGVVSAELPAVVQLAFVRMQAPHATGDGLDYTSVAVDALSDGGALVGDIYAQPRFVREQFANSQLCYRMPPNATLDVNALAGHVCNVGAFAGQDVDCTDATTHNALLFLVSSLALTDSSSTGAAGVAGRETLTLRVHVRALTALVQSGETSAPQLMLSVSTLLLGLFGTIMGLYSSVREKFVSACSRATQQYRIAVVRRARMRAHRPSAVAMAELDARASARPPAEQRRRVARACGPRSDRATACCGSLVGLLVPFVGPLVVVLGLRCCRRRCTCCVPSQPMLYGLTIGTSVLFAALGAAIVAVVLADRTLAVFNTVDPLLALYVGCAVFAAGVLLIVILVTSLVDSIDVDRAIAEAVLRDRLSSSSPTASSARAPDSGAVPDRGGASLDEEYARVLAQAAHDLPLWDPIQRTQRKSRYCCLLFAFASIGAVPLVGPLVLVCSADYWLRAVGLVWHCAWIVVAVTVTPVLAPVAPVVLSIVTPMLAIAVLVMGATQEAVMGDRVKERRAVAVGAVLGVLIAVGMVVVLLVLRREFILASMSTSFIGSAFTIISRRRANVSSSQRSRLGCGCFGSCLIALVTVLATANLVVAVWLLVAFSYNLPSALYPEATYGKLLSTTTSVNTLLCGCISLFVIIAIDRMERLVRTEFCGCARRTTAARSARSRSGAQQPHPHPQQQSSQALLDDSDEHDVRSRGASDGFSSSESDDEHFLSSLPARLDRSASASSSSRLAAPLLDAADV